MKVIFIKIYGEAEETVHVSAVSGTPLGPRDMTVISQITDRWRDGGSGGPRRSHNFRTKSSPKASSAGCAGLSTQFTPSSHFRV